jgi:hypothetical protein
LWKAVDLGIKQYSFIKGFGSGPVKSNVDTYVLSHRPFLTVAQLCECGEYHVLELVLSKRFIGASCNLVSLLCHLEFTDSYLVDASSQKWISVPLPVECCQQGQKIIIS